MIWNDVLIIVDVSGIHGRTGYFSYGGYKKSLYDHSYVHYRFNIVQND